MNEHHPFIVHQYPRSHHQDGRAIMEMSREASPPRFRQLSPQSTRITFNPAPPASGPEVSDAPTLWERWRECVTVLAFGLSASVVVLGAVYSHYFF